MTNAATARAMAGRRRSATTTAVARHFVALSTNAEAVREVRHRHRQHVRLLGLGRRPLLDGFGHRPVDDDRHRARRTSATCWRASTPWTSISAPRRSSATCRCCWACWPSGTTISSARRPSASCPTSSNLARFPAYLQQLQMESNGKHVDLAGPRASTCRPARSSGASRAPTASTRSTSSSTRARS